MNVLVAGATGKTGRRVIQELMQRQIPVKALVRDAAIAKTILPSEVELTIGDVLDPVSLRGAIAGCTALICATGAHPSFDPTGPYKVDYEGTKNLVQVAKEQGIQHFVLVSSLCVSQLLHPLNLFWLILVWKKQAEDYLRASGLIYTIVRPGGLKNEDNSDPVVMQQADTLFDGSIPRAKVAQVCVEALLQPNARNKTVEIVSREQASLVAFPDLFSSVQSG
jgi:uncharacterized protein YbjT (DUF2867 family)